MEQTYEIDGKRYIDIENFSGLCKISENQIKRRRNEIPGIIQRKGRYYVPYGSRYPFSVKRFKNLDDYKRMAILLLAIFKRKFIDNAMLGLYQEAFDKMIDNLVKMGLIEEQNLGNSYGANAYICTLKGLEIAENQKTEKICRAIKLIAEASGIFFGQIMKAVI